MTYGCPQTFEKYPLPKEEAHQIASNQGPIKSGAVSADKNLTFFMGSKSYIGAKLIDLYLTSCFHDEKCSQIRQKDLFFPLFCFKGFTDCGKYVASID